MTNFHHSTPQRRHVVPPHRLRMIRLVLWMFAAIGAMTLGAYVALPDAHLPLQPNGPYPGLTLASFGWVREPLLWALSIFFFFFRYLPALVALEEEVGSSDYEPWP